VDDGGGFDDGSMPLPDTRISVMSEVRVALRRSGSYCLSLLLQLASMDASYVANH